MQAQTLEFSPDALPEDCAALLSELRGQILLDRLTQSGCTPEAQLRMLDALIRGT